MKKKLKKQKLYNKYRKQIINKIAAILVMSYCFSAYGENVDKMQSQNDNSLQTTLFQDGIISDISPEKNQKILSESRKNITQELQNKYITIDDQNMENFWLLRNDALKYYQEGLVDKNFSNDIIQQIRNQTKGFNLMFNNSKNLVAQLIRNIGIKDIAQKIDDINVFKVLKQSTIDDFMLKYSFLSKNERNALRSKFVDKRESNSEKFSQVTLFGQLFMKQDHYAEKVLMYNFYIEKMDMLDQILDNDEQFANMTKNLITDEDTLKNMSQDELEKIQDSNEEKISKIEEQISILKKMDKRLINHDGITKDLLEGLNNKDALVSNLTDDIVNEASTLSNLAYKNIDEGDYVKTEDCIKAENDLLILKTKLSIINEKLEQVKNISQPINIIDTSDKITIAQDGSTIHDQQKTLYTRTDLINDLNSQFATDLSQDATVPEILTKISNEKSALETKIVDQERFVQLYQNERIMKLQHKIDSLNIGKLTVKGLFYRNNGQFSGFVAYDEEKHKINIAFAGSKTAMDWATNIMGWRGHSKQNGLLQKYTFHTGFIGHFNQLSPETFEMTEKILKEIAQKHPDKELTIQTTGHSLGGALAEIFGLAAKEIADKKIPNYKVRMQCITFGAPNIASAEDIKEMNNDFGGQGNIVRFVLEKDPVPRICFWLHSPGTEVFMNKKLRKSIKQTGNILPEFPHLMEYYTSNITYGVKQTYGSAAMRLFINKQLTELHTQKNFLDSNNKLIDDVKNLKENEEKSDQEEATDEKNERKDSINNIQDLGNILTNSDSEAKNIQEAKDIQEANDAQNDIENSDEKPDESLKNNPENENAKPESDHEIQDQKKKIANDVTNLKHIIDQIEANKEKNIDQEKNQDQVQNLLLIK